jgi:hypothetical protein
MALVAYLASSLLTEGEGRAAFLIGATTSGHHQIELACETCHQSPFGGPELLQKACENCHLEELATIRDSHPKRKFTDPANADRVAVLDARFCVTCHREHREEITQAMGVSVPTDVCVLCHEDVGNERATHANLAFDTCATSGCHNFHDNTALYESFLVDNAHAPPLAALPRVAPLTSAERTTLARALLTLPAKVDAPAAHTANAALMSAWSGSAHAAAQVTCNGCHVTAGDGTWDAKPGLAVCESCHAFQAEGFLAGKHGMRLAAGLDPMTTAMAREPMRADAPHGELSCNSCHDSHSADRQLAAIDACMGCHDSEHVKAYPGTPHEQLSLRAFAGLAPEESAVTCATCHMPRVSELRGGAQLTRVEHNQNLNLRPNDKMLRSVCMKCHGLAFALDVLADPLLLQNNFAGPPAVHVPSIDMALSRRRTDGLGSSPAASNQSLGEQAQ